MGPFGVDLIKKPQVENKICDYSALLTL